MERFNKNVVSFFVHLFVVGRFSAWRAHKKMFYFYFGHIFMVFLDNMQLGCREHITKRPLRARAIESSHYFPVVVVFVFVFKAVASATSCLLIVVSVYISSQGSSSSSSSSCRRHNHRS
jgi:hypothetical protein